MGRSGRPWMVNGQSVESILGSSLLEYWQCGRGVALSGSNVTSWTGSKKGLVLSPSKTTNYPTYGADGTNFRGKSVVKFTHSASGSGLQLRQLDGDPLSTASLDSLYLFAVFRMRAIPPTVSGTTPNNDQIFTIGCDSTTKTNAGPTYYNENISLGFTLPYDAGIYGSSGLGSPALAYAAALGVNSISNGAALWPTTTWGTQVTYAGGPYGGASGTFNIELNGSGSTAQASSQSFSQINAFFMGVSDGSSWFDQRQGGGYGADVSMALAGISSGVPTTAQKAAMLAYCKNEFGF